MWINFIKLRATESLREIIKWYKVFPKLTTVPMSVLLLLLYDQVWDCGVLCMYACWPCYLWATITCCFHGGSRPRLGCWTSLLYPLVSFSYGGQSGHLQTQGWRRWVVNRFPLSKLQLTVLWMGCKILAVVRCGCTTTPPTNVGAAICDSLTPSAWGGGDSVMRMGAPGWG